jgi:hypothetical protein
MTRDCGIRVHSSEAGLNQAGLDHKSSDREGLHHQHPEIPAFAAYTASSNAPHNGVAP